MKCEEALDAAFNACGRSSGGSSTKEWLGTCDTFVGGAHVHLGVTRTSCRASVTPSATVLWHVNVNVIGSGGLVGESRAGRLWRFRTARPIYFHQLRSEVHAG